MIVTLDGRRLPFEAPGPATLRAILDRVKAEHLDRRLVVEVSLNGKPLVAQDLVEQLDQTPDRDDQIDLGSDAPASLVRSALATMHEQLSLAAQAHRDVAAVLLAGQTRQAVGEFGGLVEVWQNCRTTLVECSRLMNEDWSDKEIDGRSVAAHLNELTARLREIRDAFEARDYVLLGDLLQYEMPDVCTAWASLFAKLADEVVAAPQPA